MAVNSYQQTLTRRSWTRRVAATAALGTLSNLLGGRSVQAAYPKGRYVDVHTHIGTVWNTTQLLSASDLLRWMDSQDVAQAVVLPLVSPESSSYPISTQFVLSETAAHRDRLIPFCSVDPRTSYNGSHKGLLGMLQAYQEAGVKGFGEHKPGVKIDDPLNMKLYEACAELKLPVLFHLDNQRNMDTPGLPGLENVLKTFPTLVMIGHGPGWWASISASLTQPDLGGYPRGTVAAGGAIDTLMSKYPNLYGDLSAGSGTGAIRRDMEFGRQFLIRRADRLMFGTDYLSPGQNVPQLELYGQIDLPADVQEKIYRGNARKLLGLVG